MVCTRTLAVSMGCRCPEQPLAGAQLRDYLDARHDVVGEKRAQGALAYIFRNHRIDLFLKLGQFSTRFRDPQISGTRFHHTET